MNQRPLPLANDDPEWVDALLRQDAADTAAIADDGFTHAMMSALPETVIETATAGLNQASRRPRHRWIVATMGIAGFVVGLGFLSGGEELSFLLTGLMQRHALSLEHVLMAAIPLGVLYWLALGAAWQET